ncbi:MAG: CsbD family protein [Acidobacteriaceae bacterium]
MNNDQVSGKMDQVKGKIKQGVGEAVGNDNLANRGVADQVKGDAKETWGNVKDAANKNAADDAHDTRQSIADKAKDIKDRISDKIDSVKEQHRVNETRDRTA